METVATEVKRDIPRFEVDRCMVFLRDQCKARTAQLHWHFTEGIILFHETRLLEAH